MDSRGPRFAGRCPPLPAADGLKDRAALPKESLVHGMDQASSLGGLEAWRRGCLEGLYAWKLARRLGGLVAWLLGEVVSHARRSERAADCQVDASAADLTESRMIKILLCSMI